MRYSDLIREHPDLFENEDAPLRGVTPPSRIKAWKARRLAALARQGLPAEWARIGIVLDDPYVVMVRDLVEFPDGTLHGYMRLFNRPHLNGARVVVVLPEFQGNILLLRQFRHATRDWHLEVPRGYGHPGLTDMEAVQLEIEEEVGGLGVERHSLGVVHSDTGLRGDSMHLYYAILASVGEVERMEGIIGLN